MCAFFSAFQSVVFAATYPGPPVAIEPGKFVFTPSEVDQLVLPGRGRTLHFPSIDRMMGNRFEPLEFRRLGLFAAGARTIVIEGSHQRELGRHTRDFYIARNALMGIGFAVDTISGRLQGFAVQAGERMQIRGNIVSGVEFARIEEHPDASNTCASDSGMQMPGESGGDRLDAFGSQSAALAGESLTYQAVVAVDTDSDWLSGLGDDADAAHIWIGDAFLAMNVFFERDVETRLLIGDVFLRIGTDPYSTSSDRYAQLNEFGSYWMSEMGHIERQFALKLSGRGIKPYYFSGIAWVDAYCEYGRAVNGGADTYGSYSLNAVGAARTAVDTALYIGHELGHNLGSPHTHCYNPPVDKCYNGAAANGCYSGVPQCPAAGQGTVMSYCHMGGSNGADCGASLPEFHPIVQSRIEGRLADEVSAGCISLYSEPPPEPEISSAPPAGSGFDFGEQLLGAASSEHIIQVDNLGQADLTLSCGLSGPGSGAYGITACPALISPAGQANLRFRCEPSVPGVQSATLELKTNDPDEALLSWPLICTGMAGPLDDVTFSDGFE